MNPVTATIVTSTADQLPPEFQRLADPQQPVPADVLFFEEQKTWGSFVARLAISLLLIGLGWPLITIGLAFLPLLIVGLVCWLGSILLFRSMWSDMRIMRRQRAGQATRYGVFLSSDAVLIHTDTDFTLIPRQNVAALDDNRLHYTWNDKPRALILPAKIVGANSATLRQALQDWQKA